MAREVAETTAIFMSACHEAEKYRSFLNYLAKDPVLMKFCPEVYMALESCIEQDGLLEPAMQKLWDTLQTCVDAIQRKHARKKYPIQSLQEDFSMWRQGVGREVVACFVTESTAQHKLTSGDVMSWFVMKYFSKFVEDKLPAAKLADMTDATTALPVLHQRVREKVAYVLGSCIYKVIKRLFAVKDIDDYALNVMDAIQFNESFFQQHYWTHLVNSLEVSSQAAQDEASKIKKQYVADIALIQVCTTD